MKVETIRNNLFCVQTGPIGTNTYFFKTSPTVVIDPGYGIGQILKEECVVLLTHGHFDHICGLNELNVLKVFVSKDDSLALKDPSRSLSNLFSSKFIYNGDFEVLLDEKLEIGGITFLVLRAPGHTPGSVIYKTDGLWFTGDTVFLNSIGRTDLPGSDEETMAETLEKLSKFLRESDPKEIILPGHMDWGTIEEAFSRNPFLA